MSIGAWADWIAVSAAVLFYACLFASGMVAANRAAPGEPAGGRREPHLG
jgi:hypothetical protein